MQRSGQNDKGGSAVAKSMMVLALSLVAVSVVASAQEPAKSPNVLEGSYLNWRSLPAEQAYSSIDGKHLAQEAAVKTTIARRKRNMVFAKAEGPLFCLEGDPYCPRG